MAGKVTTNELALGSSATNSQNFLLKTLSDGTAKLARGSDGSLGDILTVASDGKVTLTSGETITASKLQSATAQASTSGTSVEFTGIPSWAKRITVMLNGVGTNAANAVLVQLGSTTYTISGYLSICGSLAGASSGTALPTVGFNISPNISAATVLYSTLTLTLISGNTWLCSGTSFGRNDTANYISGSITMGGVVDRVRIIASATGSPSDTFDAGSINIMWE